MTKRDKLYEVFKRASEIGDWPIKDLRKHLAGFGNDEEPTKRDIDASVGGMSRGELIEGILREEFDGSEDLTLDEEW